ncbi:C4-dicarboxylate ABC transporter, partial [Hahella sp. CCB-MM4]
AVEAGWSTPGYWAGRVPALQLLAAVPFGPQAPEYLAWLKFGGGQEFLDELYEPHNIKSIICAVIAPEASGWFRNEINSVEDLRGLSMRFFGLGAKVMERMGVSTQLLAGGDIFPALELGTIDATEFSMPAIDLNLGFYQVASYYYFPGWHQ